jgi:hypothetical protein
MSIAIVWLWVQPTTPVPFCLRVVSTYVRRRPQQALRLFNQVLSGIACILKIGLTNGWFCDMMSHNSAKRTKTLKGEYVLIVSLIVVLLISLLLIVKEPMPVGRN